MYDATGNEPIDIERVELVLAAVNSQDASPWGLFEVWYRMGGCSYRTLSPTSNPKRIVSIIRDSQDGYSSDLLAH